VTAQVQRSAEMRAMAQEAGAAGEGGPFGAAPPFAEEEAAPVEAGAASPFAEEPLAASRPSGDTDTAPGRFGLAGEDTAGVGAEEATAPRRREAVALAGLSVDDLPEELVSAIVERVVRRLSDEAVREIAWQVVPDLAELLIKKKLEELG
jgi:hypothetical protein